MITLPETGATIKNYCFKYNLKHSIHPLPMAQNCTVLVPSLQKEIMSSFLPWRGLQHWRQSRPRRLLFEMCEKGKCLTSNARIHPRSNRDYPTQLHQAISALRSVLQVTPLSRISTAGDSAGGHLSAGLLSYLIHPLEDVEPIQLKEKLGGICFICPFLSFDYNKKKLYLQCGKGLPLYLQL
ncbi:hypothetical protein BKA61DRAFT_612035 [Leptodontidium sp. MPI-SDFR-AT-0119]|nr:hypothetical protein BKA61DRAFT_612035 [Leptodontidium sp. MPI-SDFR-AT-0119]